MLIVVLVGTGLRRELVAIYQGELERELRLAETVANERTGDGPQELAHFLARRLSLRVTLVDTAGVVVGESDLDLGQLSGVENHRSRPEVLGALEGQVSFAQRRSATVGRRLLYGARFVEFAGEPLVLRIAASLDEIDGAVRRSQRAVGVAGLLSLLLALAVSYGLSRRLAAPLVSLSRTARSVAAGDLTQRVPRRARVAELDDLSVAFNRLTDELQARLSELARERDETQVLIDCMAEGVIAVSADARVIRWNPAAQETLGLEARSGPAPLEDVVPDPALRRVLEEAVSRPVGTREVQVGDRHLVVSASPLDVGGAVATFLDISEIRRLEAVRRDFVANASHELKTPLTAMRGWAETLADDDPPEAIRKQILASIRKNSIRLQHLVEDLLDLSRLETGSWEVQDEMVTVHEVIEEVWADYAGRAGERGIDFSVEGTGWATADAQGVAHVMRNLIDNALRYTDRGGRIVVRLETDGRMLAVSCADTGVGIPQEALPRIFERFYRVDPARSRQAGGTGLGLAIVRHLVQAMGGEVTAVSVEGQGTTIRFTLRDWDAPTRRADEPPGGERAGA